MDEVKLFEDSDGQLILPLSEEILNQMGWHTGDELLWEMNDEHSVYLTKKQD